MGAPEDDRHAGLADAIGGAAIFPARVAARAWRGRLEAAVDEVLSAPELARVVDRALAGPLPEELARSLVRHRVLERIVEELAASGELDRLLEQALGSPKLLELEDTALESEAVRRAVRSVVSGPELHSALAAQSSGLAEQLAAALRAAARRLDARAGRPARPGYGGIASRGIALALDALLTLAIFTAGSALVALIAGPVGGLRPAWLAAALLSVGWALIGCAYLVLFWTAVRQTPGMRLMHLRVRLREGDGGLSAARSLVRAVGLALAIVPMLAGFLPALFDDRRRALPDLLAGTVVVYDEASLERPPFEQ